MDAETCAHWSQRELRRTPLVLWGLDETSRDVVRLFIETLETCAQRPELLDAFEPKADPERELRDLVAHLAESALATGNVTEFEIKVVAASWQVSAVENIECLRLSNRVLESILPGDQSLALTVLLPPHSASDEVKGRLSGFFEELEKLPGSLPFLSAVFVHQLPRDVFQHPLDTAPGTADLLERLFRETVDAELLKVIRQFPYHAIGSQRKIDGRKACYSTIGAHRLVYGREEGLEYLKARFLNTLYEKGLANPENLSPQEAAGLRQRNQDYWEQFGKAVEGRFADVPEAAAYLPGRAEECGESERVAGDFEREFNAAEEQMAKELIQPLCSQQDRLIRSEFDKVLRISPSYLAGANAFLVTLRDDFSNFQVAFCWKPLATGLPVYYQQKIDLWSSASQIRVEPQRTDSQSHEAVRDAAAVFHEATADAIKGFSAPAWFFAATWDLLDSYMGNQAGGTRGARQLLTDTLELFFEASRTLVAQDQQNQDQQQAVREDLAALEGRYSWFSRMFSRAYASEKQGLLTELEALERQRQGYDWAFDQIREFCLELIGGYLWPHIVKLRFIEAFDGCLETLHEGFKDFDESIDQACSERWQKAQSIPKLARSTATTIVNEDRLDLLFQETVAQKKWLQLAAEALAFLPNHLGQDSEKIVYRACHNLCDHYHAGPELLLKRLSDFTDDRFAGLQDLDALDMIEVGGTEQAQELLSQTLARTESQVTFTTTITPLLQGQGLPERLRVIRCPPCIRDRLLKNYGYLFGANDQFPESYDETGIDVTTFIFGFPAFMLHLLHEAKQIAPEGQETSGQAERSASDGRAIVSEAHRSSNSPT